MDIVLRSKTLMLGMGAAPILYLMIALSVVSIAVIVERAWYFFRASGDVRKLAAELDELLHKGGPEAARERFEKERSVEAAVVTAGLAKAEKGADVAMEAMTGASAMQRMRLERGLAYLGTLGSNAPFIGLLGTVVGIITAFQRLGDAGQNVAASGASAEVMSSIAEALVATAVGLAVAIPAIVAYNYFQRRIKAISTNTDALGRVLVAWLKSRREHTTADEVPPPSRRPSLTLARRARAAGGEV